MSPGQEHDRPAASEDWAPLEGAVKRFVAAWRQGASPAISDYLPAGGALRRALLVELVHTELELRLKAGEAVRVEDYLASYPELAGDRPAVLELIAAEYELRRRSEPQLSLDDYLQRFPQYRADLAEQIARATLPYRGARATPPAQAEGVAPDEVPGYEVLGVLGKGGMGVVYKARQKSLDRLVALKFLPAECARDPVWLERFRREALTASALNHPHICTIYDLGECAGRPFLSMELIEGRTLADLVGERPAVEEVARLIAQAARALAAAHAAGVVHRDVKPENLMVRGDGIIKVLDFGLARRLPDSVTRPAGDRSTDPGTLVGTLLYMSPEQARAEPVGTASDIFSLGVVLYELITGRHPFPGESEVGVLYALAVREPVPPSRLNPEVPAPLEALLQQMLAKDPRRRPTAPEVDAALTQLRGKWVGRPGQALQRPGKGPTVGRRDERAALQAGFDLAAAGHGLMLCVTGEPGLGKTRLVEDFLDELAAGQPCSIARGRCSERLAGTEAFLPFLEALDGLLRGRESAAPVMKLLAPTWYVQLVPSGLDDPTPQPGLEEAKGASQERLKRELGVFLQEVARLRPLVLVLDDVHWADPSSVDLLAYLGGRCAGLPWLLVLTYRPSDLALSRHPFAAVKLDLQGRGVCREIALPFLTRADLDRYLALTFPAHQFPEEFADLIHAKTEGNPLFMVDLLRYLRDRGIVRPQGEQVWVLAQPVPDLHRELPESVRCMIERKIAQLDEADRRLVTAASVQGPEFDSAVLAAVLGLGAAEVEERLEVLERVHVLVRFIREREFPDRTLTLRYGFVHVLYQNALYASLRPTRKAAWSAAAARALLGHYGEKSAPVATELALLFEAARQPGPAARYFLQAAEHAVAVCASQEAVVLARRGLGLLQQLPDAAERARQELALLIALGVSLVPTKGFASPEVEETYLRARALCRQTRDDSTLLPVLYGLWNLYLVRCELARCKELAAQLFSLAEGHPEPALLLAHNVLQQPLFHLGEFAAARLHQEKGLALYDPHRHRPLTAVYGEDPGVGCLVYGGVTLWHLGYPEQALRSARQAHTLAEELAHPFNMAQALYYGTCTHLCRREVNRVGEMAEALMELCREHGFALLLAGGLVLHGWSLTKQGQAEEGIGQMRQGLADWQATGALSHRPVHLALLAEALGAEGRAREGLTTLAEALALATATGEQFWEAELYRLQGECLLACAEADPAEAEACFRQALEVARRQGARSLELRAALSLGRLFLRQGRREQGRQIVAGTFGWFTEGVDTLDHRDAQALLEELG
jgi:predicted ATPase